MRGIIFTGGVQPDQPFLDSWIAPYSFVVAADSGLMACERSGIVADLILGDMDSLPDPSLLARYPFEKIRKYETDKDYSDTELALAAMAERGVDDVVIVGGDGGRMDHFFALRSLFDREGTVPSMWIGSVSAVIAFGTGATTDAVFVNGVSHDDPVSVFAAGIGPHACRGEGLQWPIDGLGWDRGACSLSNRADRDGVSIESDAGRFLLVVPFREGISVSRFQSRV
jgi:thiamine pyrophosphokinase